MRIGAYAVAAVFVALLAGRGRAEDAPAPSAAPATPEPPPAPPPAFHLDGLITAGYRNVDIDGSRVKYREDYNPRSGGRLFALESSGRASDPDAEWVDRFHLEVDTPQPAEPVSHFLLTAN